jgi:hypothetical protein
MRYAYAIVTFSNSPFLNGAVASIPEGERVLVVNNTERRCALAANWNYAVDKLLWEEAYDAVVIMNDDVVLRPDTGKLLAWGILVGQFENKEKEKQGGYESYLPESWPEILLLSARHASPSDACTDVPDQELLVSARPIWQPGPDFSCFCVSRRLGQEVGRFDEGFNPAYFEDNDTHRRIQLAGFEGAAFAPYWHFRSGSFRASPERRREIQSSFEHCKRYYCQKWGAPYDMESPIGRETFSVPFGAV